jgi:hypothetical protein
MRRILAATALAGLIASPALAKSIINGVSLNGLQLQGMSANGLHLQGMSANGIRANGMKVNGAAGEAFAPVLRSITLGGGATLAMTAD